MCFLSKIGLLKQKLDQDNSSQRPELQLNYYYYFYKKERSKSKRRVCDRPSKRTVEDATPKMDTTNMTIKLRVNWFCAITIWQVQRSAITIRIIGYVPLQFSLYRADAILYAWRDVGPICRVPYTSLSSVCPILPPPEAIRPPPTVRRLPPPFSPPYPLLLLRRRRRRIPALRRRLQRG